LDVIGRGTLNFAEILGDPKQDIAHLGFAFSGGNRLASNVDGNIGGDGVTRTRSLTFLDLTKPTMGTTFATESTVRRVGLEGILARGPFKLQGQFVNAGYEFTHQTGPTSYDVDINTGYAQATWTLTGETHAGRYKDGVLSGLKPTKPFDPDTFTGGAWETALRIGHFDASDYRGNQVSPATGALKATDYTLGLMFVPSPNVRFMGNFVHTSFSDLLGAGPQVAGKTVSNENAILFRTQLAF
jgi:phosphate-selective porin OprO/OprP